MRGATAVRAYSTTNRLRINLRESLSNLTRDQGGDKGEREAEEQETFDADNDYEEHASEHHNHGDPTYPRPGLPLSPLMDPAFHAAKHKYGQPKAPPPKILTPFQERLGKNPYAKALITPVRMCVLTRIHLPSFFLVDFELITHPTTLRPWSLPRSLSRRPKSAIVDKSDSIVSPDDSILASTTGSPLSSKISSDSDDHPPPSPTEEILSKSPSSKYGRLGPRSYILSRASLLEATVSPRSGFTNRWRDFFAGRFSECKSAPSKKKIQWRSDIDLFVLKLLRRRLIEGLKIACDQHGWCLLDCEKGWMAVGQGGKKQLGAVMWLGSEEEQTDVGKVVDETVNKGEPEGSEEQKKEESGIREMSQGDKEEDGKKETWEGPEEFATMERKEGWTTKIPVYNMQTLLGGDHIRELRAFNPDLFRGELVAIKHRRQTVDIQLLLWKIQGYIAEHVEI